MKKIYLLMIAIVSISLFSGCSNKDVIKEQKEEKNIEQIKNKFSVENTSNGIASIKFDNKDILENIKKEYDVLSKEVYGNNVSVNYKKADVLNIKDKEIIAVAVEDKTSDDKFDRIFFVEEKNGAPKILHTEVEGTYVKEGMPAVSFEKMVDKDKFIIKHYIPVNYIKDFDANKTREYKIEADFDDGKLELEYKDLPKPEHNLDIILKDFSEVTMLNSYFNEDPRNMAPVMMQTEYNRLKSAKSDFNYRMYSLSDKYTIMNNFAKYMDISDYDDVIEILNYKNFLAVHGRKINYYEEDDSSANKTDEELKSIVEKKDKPFIAIRFLKDDTILSNMISELGGVVPLPEENKSLWRVNGDKVEIDYKLSAPDIQEKIVYTATYKLNDREYVFDKMRNTYYLSKIKYNK